MNKFNTNSMPVAAYLLATGHKLKDLGKELNKTIFIFDGDKEKIEKLASGYFLNTPVPGMDFWEALRRIKSMIHNA